MILSTFMKMFSQQNLVCLVKRTYRWVSSITISLEYKYVGFQHADVWCVCDSGFYHKNVPVFLLIYMQCTIFVLLFLGKGVRGHLKMPLSVVLVCEASFWSNICHVRRSNFLIFRFIGDCKGIICISKIQCLFTYVIATLRLCTCAIQF